MWSTGRAATGSGDDILKRAIGAKFGLGGHQAIENRSYAAQADAQGNRIDGTKPLTLRLRPTTDHHAVHSVLTAYGGMYGGKRN